MVSMNAFSANVINIRLLVSSNISNVFPKNATIKSKATDKHTPIIVIITVRIWFWVLCGIIMVNTVQKTISKIHNKRITKVFI